MLPLHPVSSAVQADREREIRERMPAPVGVSTARRRPAVALSVEMRERPGSSSTGALEHPRVAPTGQA